MPGTPCCTPRFAGRRAPHQHFEPVRGRAHRTALVNSRFRRSIDWIQGLGHHDLTSSSGERGGGRVGRAEQTSVRQLVRFGASTAHRWERPGARGRPTRVDLPTSSDAQHYADGHRTASAANSVFAGKTLRPGARPLTRTLAISSSGVNAAALAMITWREWPDNSRRHPSCWSICSCRSAATHIFIMPEHHRAVPFPSSTRKLWKGWPPATPLSQRV